MTVSSSGTRWISSITTVSLPGEPASSSRRRSGWAPRLRCSAGSSRSRYSASASWSRNHVDLPVPRGPSRKQLWSGIWKNRLTSSILSRKMEFQIPIFALLGPKINRLSWNERAASCFRHRYGVNSRTPVSVEGSLVGSNCVRLRLGPCSTICHSMESTTVGTGPSGHFVPHRTQPEPVGHGRASGLRSRLGVRPASWR